MLSRRGKFGEEVEAALGARRVSDLLPFSRADLVRRFGEQRGALLAGLPHAEVGAASEERGREVQGWLPGLEPWTLFCPWMSKSLQLGGRKPLEFSQAARPAPPQRQPGRCATVATAAGC